LRLIGKCLHVGVLDGAEYSAPQTGTAQLLGHRDVATTMIYTHVLNRGGLGVRSPLDTLTPPRKGGPFAV